MIKLSKKRMTPLDLMGLWNEHCGALPKIKEVSKTRRAKMITRLKECDDEAQWIAAIQYYAKSPWHNGENDRGWVADIGFLLKPDSRIKAIERLEAQPKSTHRLEEW